MRETNLIISDLDEIRAGDVAVMGVPWEEGSSFLRGTAQGPARIREALLSPARSLVTESGIDLGQVSKFHLLGDLELRDGDPKLTRVESAANRVYDRGGRLLALGGDHSISVGLVRACSQHSSSLTVLQIDAHPDLYDEYEGNRHSHACPMARIMEEGLVDRLIQVGIRAMTPEQRVQAQRFGVEVIDMQAWAENGVAELGLTGPLYLSLDLDGLDPAFAPGVSHPEPGGLTTRQTITLVQNLPVPIVGADLVELNALRDPQGLTAVVAAKLVKEIVARLLEGTSA